MVMYVSDELDFKIFLVIVLNQFHATIFIIPHIYYVRVRFKSSGSLGNEISDGYYVACKPITLSSFVYIH